LGYGHGIVRHVGEADIHGRIDQVNVIISTFFVVYVGIGFAALAVTAGLSQVVLPHFPHLTAADIATPPPGSFC